MTKLSVVVLKGPFNVLRECHQNGTIALNTSSFIEEQCGICLSEEVGGIQVVSSLFTSLQSTKIIDPLLSMSHSIATLLFIVSQIGKSIQHELAC